MRHLLANLAVYILATGLVVGSIVFAWMRDAQIVVTTEREIEPREYAELKDPADFDWQEVGRRIYVANCRNCHGLEGGGYGVNPPVTGQIETFAAPGGRDYLSRLVVYGLVTGRHTAPMPPMPHLSDAQIAAVNNYLLTRFDDPARLPDGARLYVPRDVRRIRGEGLSERDVGRTRPAPEPASDPARP